MILPCHHVYTLGFLYVVLMINSIIHNNLVGALPNLSFPVEHETATKRVNLILKSTWCMPTSSIDGLSSIVIHVFPLGFVVFNFFVIKTLDFELGNFFVCFIIETAKKITSIVHVVEAWAFSWSWLPTVNRKFNDCYIKTIPLLHSLDVGLQSSRQLFNKFISGDVISGLGNEKLWAIFFIAWAWFDYFVQRLYSITFKFSWVEIVTLFLKIFFFITILLWWSLKPTSPLITCRSWHGITKHSCVFALHTQRLKSNAFLLNHLLFAWSVNI